MTVGAKICGLNDKASIKAAVEGGADFIGMVFFPPSPRAISATLAAELAQDIPARVKKVGLFVDADDALLKHVCDHVALDMLQLHGSESPERVAEISKLTGLPIIKVIKIASRADLAQAKAYEPIVEMLLFDAKAPKSMKNALPGGNGLIFDWTMLKQARFSVDWMLAGGLNKENVSQAVLSSGAKLVDTSSGVEFEPGRKNPAAISEFLQAVNAL